MLVEDSIERKVVALRELGEIHLTGVTKATAEVEPDPAGTQQPDCANTEMAAEKMRASHMNTRCTSAKGSAAGHSLMRAALSSKEPSRTKCSCAKMPKKEITLWSWAPAR